MEPSLTPTVLAAVQDLFFQVQIRDAAKRAGLDVEIALTAGAASQALERKPRLAVVDLTLESAIDIVGALAGRVRVFAFVPHVQAGLKQAALAAGADRVAARSNFSQQLPDELAAALTRE